jgi:nucleolar protein 14
MKGQRRKQGNSQRVASRVKSHAVEQRMRATGASKNPFEQIRTRKKFNVLGKKQKGDMKRTTQMRSAAVEKRRDTLLVEYKQLRKRQRVRGPAIRRG